MLTEKERRWPDDLVTALAPVLPLLEDERITEIEANGFDEVWCKGTGWSGHRRASDVRWRDHEDFRIACVRVSAVIGRAVSARRPLLNARLPDGARVNIALPPACDRIAMTIRKFPAETMTLERLVRLGSIDETVRKMLESLVLVRQSIIVAGGTGAGKTSLLNALSRVIPHGERIVTIEDARELQILQPNWVSLETVEPYEAGVEPVTIEDLVRNSLRMSPDRIVVGEVRGGEALHLLRAFSSGHGGGFGTLHANDGVDALHQIQVLAQMSPVALSSEVVAAMVARAVDIVVYQEYFEHENVRRVSEILEVLGTTMAATGAVEYKVARLLAWNADEGRWDLPEAPSPTLTAQLRRRVLFWPGKDDHAR